MDIASPLFAVEFASPWLLWGLLLGSLPIIVHLLHKSAFRQTEWAAMRFLMDATRKHARRLRLEQLILMAVRVLALLLLVLGFARPYFESAAVFSESVMPAHHIIVIDASFSMGHQPAASSRFDRAKEAARAVVSSSHPGDVFNLVQICQQGSRVIVKEPTFESLEMTKQIDRLSLKQEPGLVLESLQVVIELLEAAPTIKRKEVYIFSDLQRSSWTPPEPGRLAEIRQRFEQISERADLTVVNLGVGGTANSAVVDLKPNESSLATGQSMSLRASLMNYSEAQLNGQPVELYVDDQLAQAKSVDLPPQSETHVGFSIGFDSSGEHQIEVRLAEDALSIDDRRWLALSAKDEFKVLLVDGRPSRRSAQAATGYVQTALAPSTAREAWQGATRPVVISDGELTGYDLAGFDCVFLCNVGLFTEQEAGLLETFVRGGGAVVFCLGSQVRAENYNRVLYRDGQGLLPARLGNRKQLAESSDDGYHFDPTDLSHPIVRPFEGNPGTGLESTIVLEYVQAEIAPGQEQSRVVLKYLSGDPAIVESQLERGRSVLVTTSVDTEWGNWPLQPSFVPMIHEIVRYAVSSQRGDQQRLVGDPLVQTFPRFVSEPARISRPDGRDESVAVTFHDNLVRMSYDGTDSSGIYKVSAGPSGGISKWFAVNIDRRESDLSALSRDDLKSELLPTTDFSYWTTAREIVRKPGGRLSTHPSMSRWLIVAALCLLLIEPLMAWRFPYGLMSLYGVVAAGFVLEAGRRSLFMGSFVFLLLLGVFVAIVVFARRTRT